MSNKTRRITAAALSAASICVMSMLSVSFGEIAFSLSLLAVFVSGLILSPEYAVAANVVYIIIGAVGLPVFSNFSGGLGVLFGKSGGFIICYPIMAFIVSIVVHKFGYKIPFIVVSLTLSLLLCYTVGTAWFVFVTGVDLSTALVYCVLPFFGGDICKCFVACITAKYIRKHI